MLVDHAASVQQHSLVGPKLPRDAHGGLRFPIQSARCRNAHLDYLLTLTTTVLGWYVGAAGSGLGWGLRYRLACFRLYGNTLPKLPTYLERE